MKKLAIILSLMFLFGTQSMRASGIRFTENKTFKQLLALAKAQHKLIFLDGYASWCGPCKYLQQNIFTQTKVGTYFNANFINAAMDMEKGEGPVLSEKFGITAYPTLFFINAEGSVVHKEVGAIDADELITLAHDAKDPKKQYYTIKNNAALGKLTPSDFLAWVKTAEGLKDPDVGGIVEKYLSLPGHNLLQKDMLQILCYHSGTLTDGQLKTLQQNRSIIMSLMAIDSANFDDMFIGKVVDKASEEAYRDSTLNFSQFKTIASVYLPASQVALQTVMVKVRYYDFLQQYTKALDALSLCFDQTNYQIKIADLTRLVRNNAQQIADNKRGEEFIDKLSTFNILPEDEHRGYFLDIAQMLIWHDMGNNTKANAAAVKIENNVNTPEDVKDAIKKYSVEKLN